MPPPERDAPRRPIPILVKAGIATLAAVILFALVVGISVVVLHPPALKPEIDSLPTSIPASGSGRATPGPDPALVREVASALKLARKLPGVDSATNTQTQTGGDEVGVAPDSGPSYFENLTVGMDPTSTPAEAAQVVIAMKGKISNTAVNLDLVVPGSAGRARSELRLNGAFDTDVQSSTVQSTMTSIATLATTPAVTGVRVSVPYTWNLNAGDVAVSLSPDDISTEQVIRDTASTTAFAQTALGFVPTPTATQAPTPTPGP